MTAVQCGDLDPPEGGMQAEVDGESYFVSKSTSYTNWFISQGFLVDGKPEKHQSR